MTGWHEGPLLAFDTETTGVDAHTCRIVQVGLATITPGEGILPRLWMVDPGVDIPEQASAIHGITTARCREDGEAPERVRKGKRNLTTQCAHYDVQLDGAHDAGHDATAAARLAWRIAQRHPQIAAMTPRDLHQAQIGWAQQQADSLRAYFDSRGIAHDGCDGTWPVRRQQVSA